MSRDYLLYLDDIELALDRIDRYTQGLSFDAFSADDMRVDAVVRNLETLGEAVKHLSDDIRAQAPETPWAQIAGLRDVLAHAYFSVNLTLIWDIVTNEAPGLRPVVKRLREDLANP
jgi:uncharacterized protein with HEPN domain